MKKNILLAVLIVLAAAIGGLTQTTHTFSALDTNNHFTGTQTFDKPVITSYVVSGLPAGPSTNQIAWVVDGTNSTDCTTGSGSTRVLCVFTGSAWTAYAPVASNGSSQTSFSVPATNFGSTPSGSPITLLASAPSGMTVISVYETQTRLGVNCNSGSSDSNINVLWTDTNGQSQSNTVAILDLAPNQNGSLTNGQNFSSSSPFGIWAQAGSVISYQVFGGTAPGGCTTLPQYQASGKIFY